MSSGLEILSCRVMSPNIWRFAMKPGDLVKREGKTGLIVEVMWANNIRWLKLYGKKDWFSEIGWRVISESR